MGYYLINEETLLGIANAIRNKTSSEDLIKVTQMAEKIQHMNVRDDPVLESLSITPNGKEISKVPSSGFDGFGIVTIAGDENLISENIVDGVTIYGVVGTHESDGIDTFDATAEANDIMEGATAYVDGIKITGTHVCKSDPVLGSIDILPNGQEITETPEDGVDGFSEVTVLGDYNLTPDNIRSGVTIYGVMGTYSAEDSGGDSGGSGGSGGGLTEEVLQELVVTPVAKKKIYLPDEGYTGFSTVTVKGDADLVAKNIVKGIKIFGVTGTADFDNIFISGSSIGLKGVISDILDLIYEETEV